MTTSAAEQNQPENGKKIPFTGLPTENPNSTVVPGKMRSDREELPEGYTKEDADKAEIAEAKIMAAAKLRAGNARSSATATNAVAASLPTDCMTYFPAWQYQVCGQIRVKYDSLGGSSSFLLFPTSNELVNPDLTGRRQLFANGPIYWHPTTGAHPVVNHFHQKWGQYGYEAGWLGYPKTDEIVLNGGRLQDFQGATIYWSPLTGAHPVGGAIRDKWAQTGWEGGPLGYPTTDEIWVGANGEGRMNRFERGVIYWSPSTGAHPVSGGILDVWANRGYESGTHGYPTSDEYDYNGGRRQNFQQGVIDWNPGWSIDIQPGIPLGPSQSRAQNAVPDEIVCQLRAYKNGSAEVIGPGLPIWVTIVADAACSSEPEVWIATLRLWEYDGSTYTLVDENIDNTPTTYEEYAVSAPCKPLHQYHVEFEAEAFHGHWDSLVQNSDAQVYC